MSVAAASGMNVRSFDHLNIAAFALQGAQQFAKSAQGLAAAASPVQALVDQFRNSASPMEQGALLRSIDSASGGRANTDAIVRGDSQVNGQQAAGAQAPSAPTPPKYDASSLYGAGGPSMNDIYQNKFGDCYYVATLGAVANEKPDAIRNAISYDANTQSFNVTLYDGKGKPHVQNVTQADIDSNIARGGGSGRDNGNATAPVWPDVMEVAYAKQLDKNHSDGIEQGYKDLANGGWAKDANQALLGNKGRGVGFDQGWFESKGDAMDRLGGQVRDALANGKPVTLSTDAEDWEWLPGDVEQDGLVDNHVYTVTGMSQDANGKWQVELRNPWGQNQSSESKIDSAIITVPLEKLVDTGGLDEFRIAK